MFLADKLPQVPLYDLVWALYQLSTAATLQSGQVIQAMLLTTCSPAAPGGEAGKGPLRQDQ